MRGETLKKCVIEHKILLNIPTSFVKKLLSF